MLTGEQIRAARALARIEQTALAVASGVSLPTIKRLETMVGPISANTGTEAALRKAFTEAGVIFIDENGEGPGVRLRKGRPT
jgi:transcriptional regulator with XRE-family HTH domain